MGNTQGFTLGYRPGLDGLRGVAVLLVIASHAGSPEYGIHGGGAAGVTLFFVVSGFLITVLLCEERARTGRIDLRAFWRRRASRLLPALAVMLPAVVLALVVLGYQHAVRDGLISATYVQNWFRAAGTPMPYLSHMWSLAIEEQFYLAWPLLFVAARGRHRRLMGGLAVAAVASLALSLAPLSDIRWDSGTDTRGYSLLVGCLLGLVAHHRGLPRLPRPAVWAAVGVLAVAVGGTTSTRLSVFLATAAGVVLVVWAVEDGRTSPGWLRWSGRRCYALYLWHKPITVLLVALPWVSRFPLTLAASVAIAAVSWRYVEEPALRWGRSKLAKPASVPDRAQSAASSVAAAPASR